MLTTNISDILKFLKNYFGLYNKLDDDLKDNCYFGELNKEMHLKNGQLNKNYFVDFNLKNACLEFNGTYWHADPRKYKKDDIIKDILAETIWENDMIKQNFIKQNYKLLVIWEDDYNNDKDKIINDCVEFIMRNIKDE